MRRSCMGPEKNTRSIFKINHPDWMDKYCLSDSTLASMDLIRDDLFDIVEFDWDNEMTLAKFLYPNNFWDLGECESHTVLFERFIDLSITKSELNKNIVDKIIARVHAKRHVSKLFKEYGKGGFGFIFIDGDGLLSVPKKINEYAMNHYGYESLMNWKCLPIFSENKLYRQVDEDEYDENITTTCIAINKLDNGWPPLKLNSLEEYYHWLNSENSGPIFRETLPQFKDCGDIFIAAYGAKDINTVEYVKTNNGRIKKGFKYLIGIKDDESSELKELKSETEQLKRDILVSEMSASMTLSVYRDKMNQADAIKKFADEKKIPIKEAKELAKLVTI